MPLQNWNEIKNRYHEPDLLLGNGFSINISNMFNYNSLYEVFLSEAEKHYKTLFQKFETTNFELILEHLKHTVTVNKIFDIEFQEINESIQKLKEGLIQSIKTIHPRQADINHQLLKSLTKQIVTNFNDVYTLNYDLFLYHIIMKSNDLFRLSVIQ